MVNQKHYSTLGPITTEKISKIPMQCQLANILNRSDHDFNNHTKFIIIVQLRSIRTISIEALNERLK